MGIAKVFGENLRKLRLAKGLTQAELADAIDVKAPTVTTWEIGTRWPGLDNISALAKILEIEEFELFQTEDSPKSTVSQALVQFGQLLGKADPERVKEAIELLEIGQEQQSERVRKSTSRT